MIFEKFCQGYNIAFPLLVMKVLPTPALGLVVAAMLAALMSSLASIFNSTSTLFTMDIWRHFQPGASEKELVFVGKIVTVFVAAVGMLWVFVLDSIATGLYIYTHKVMTCTNSIARARARAHTHTYL